MSFSEAYLQALINARVMGDFAPFALGEQGKVEAYIRQLVDRLRQNTDLVIEADFASYGSGYASYVPVNISKADKSDTTTLGTRQPVTYQTNGLLLYISRLVPYWFYGGSGWTASYEHGQRTGGSGGFLEPASQADIDLANWQATQQWLEATFAEHRYRLLTAAELAQPAPASITAIATILADAPYQVFDCFFYWED
ncbi:MAG: hypothetical protein ACRYFK_19115 [Janthinobacterium lividum]